ncbi:MAG TPA: GNAT family N-acetyltransferase, partial [Candidatus Saccharimonadia bacterium]|nr:GNAT family N-acetyltransferase [Candidatus Saccharimonadia bacterium]
MDAAIAETTGRLEAWGAEDDPSTLATLTRLGFRRQELRLSQFQRRLDGDSPIGEGVPPAGCTLRHVSGHDEIAARVEIHRAAFAPSQMTVEKYARRMSLPHYRFEDDLVVEAPDGSLAAFAMAWWDPAAEVGEFEPVGTHPEHQRRGLGRALLSHGLTRYRDLGARIVQIYSMSDNEASEGLYQAV